MTDSLPKLAYNAFSLANLADCGTPDSAESPGAAFLLGVQDAVNDLDHDDRFLTLQRDSDGMADPDAFTDDVSEIADGAPSVYTYAKWQQFTDLAAWQEDISDYADGSDLDKAASVALYVIAERLAQELVSLQLDAAANMVSAEDDDDDTTEA